MVKEIVLNRILVFIFLIVQFSCSKDKTVENNPFSIVVKLESAEAFRDFKVAEQFIDVEKVYGQIALNEKKKAEAIWKEYVNFNYLLGTSSKKFSECFPFHRYQIVEEDLGELFRISFKGEDNKCFFYELKRENNRWMVVKRGSCPA